MVELGDFCIEWLHSGAGPCVLCEEETGTGPVGWHKADPVGPVCDRCMIDRERGLGALLMTANVMRELVEVPTEGDHSAYDQVVMAMMAYARRYNIVESAWPIRRFHFLEILEELDEQMMPSKEVH